MMSSRAESTAGLAPPGPAAERKKICFIGVGLVVPVSTAKAMAPFDDNAGAASLLLGFLRMGVAALGTIAMSAMYKGSVLDIPIVFLALSVSAVVLFVVYLSLRGKPPQPAAS